jgi:hypothetical protein
MKNLIMAILFVTTVGFGVLAFKEKQKTKEDASTITALRENLSDAETRLQEQEKQTAKLQNNLLETKTEAVVHQTQVTHLEQALTNQVEAASNAAAKSSNPMADMFKNKDMRNLIRTQQKAVMGPLIEKNFASFFSSLGLNSEQKAGLKELLVKKGMVDAELGVSMLSGEADAEKRTEMAKQAHDDKEAINEEIKQLLGEEGYAQYKEFEKTEPERTAIGMFKDQLASGANALTPEQENLLTKGMGEERRNFKFTTDYYDKSKYDLNDLGSMFTEEKINQFEQEQKQLNEKYLARAQTILTAEQLGTFEKFLTSQSEMQRAGMKMAIQMFGKKN